MKLSDADETARPLVAPGGRERALFLLLWCLFVVQWVTLSAIPPFSLLSALTSGPNLIVLGFVVSSLAFAHPRLCWLLPIHLGLVLIAIACHPLTAYFGRDGSLIVFLAYFLVVIIRLTSLRAQYKLLVTTSMLSLLAVEGLLSALTTSPQERFEGLKDYDDLVSDYREGGFLVPGLDEMVVGDTEPVRFVTNALGFRDRDEVAHDKPSGTSRVLLIGDSFASGFRTDQDDMIGQVLEDALREATGDSGIEVLVAGAAHPGAYLDYLERHGFRFDPDLVVIGLTLGNDLSHSYGARTAKLTEAEMFTESFLPRDAFTDGRVAPFLVRVDRTLQPWRIYRTLAPFLRSDGIGSWARDVPFDVHVFGPNHSLGHFYARRPIDVVEASFDDLFFYLTSIDTSGAAHGLDVVFFLIPQRFQVSERDWRGVVFQFALDETAFDLELPNRRILVFCETAALACHDLLPDFQSGPRDELHLPRGDMHWNARGHRLAGESVARYLLDGSHFPP